MSETRTLYLAREAIRQGDKGTARRFLVRAVRTNPHSETAWLMLSVIVDDPAKEQECLERVLEINPHNEVARRHLAKSNGSGAPQPDPDAQETSSLSVPCPYCGNLVRASARFCDRCGHDLEAGEPPAAATASPAAPPVTRGTAAQAAAARDLEIARLARKGWRVVNRTETAVQLQQDITWKSAGAVLFALLPFLAGWLLWGTSYLLGLSLAVPGRPRRSA
jgi:hypothetical protein